MNYSSSQITKAQRVEDQLSLSFGLIILVFSICWTPLYIANGIFAVYKDVQIPIKFFQGFVILSCSSTAINPILYAFRMKDFRKSSQAMLKKICCCIKHEEIIFRRQKSNTLYSTQLSSKSNTLYI